MPKTLAKRRDRRASAGSPPDRSLDQESHHFERLVADLSAAVVRATVGSIDHEIERCLERIVVTLRLDRSTVFQLAPNGIPHISRQWDAPVCRGHRGLPMSARLPLGLPPESSTLAHPAPAPIAMLVSVLQPIDAGDPSNLTDFHHGLLGLSA